MEKTMKCLVFLLLIAMSCSYKGYIHDKEIEPYSERHYEQGIYRNQYVSKGIYMNVYSHTNLMVEKDHEDYVFIFKEEKKDKVIYKRYYVDKVTYKRYGLKNYLDSKHDKVKLYKFDWNNDNIIIGRK